MFEPSPYQKEIFEWIKTGSGHAVIEAVSGSGKTSTCLKAMELIDDHLDVVFLAFNKSIAEELKGKVPRHVKAMTLNGLGHRLWASSVGKVLLDVNKIRNIIDDLIDKKSKELEPLQLEPLVNSKFVLRRMMSIARHQMILPKSEVTDEDTKLWLNVFDHFNLELPKLTETSDPIESLRLILPFFNEVFRQSVAEKNVIDFDDQLFMPVAYGTSFGQYDWVFVDEAQDMSPVQHKLVSLAVRDGGRLVAVGDRKQSIYGFRGADNFSMDNLKQSLDAQELKLSICYRCPKSHIELARSIVKQIEASPWAKPGEIKHFETWDHKIFKPGDLVLCRCNAPLLNMAFMLIREGVPSYIEGMDLGEGLIKLIDSLGSANIVELEEDIGMWHQRQLKKLLKIDPETSTQLIDDKKDCILLFCGKFQRHSIQMLKAEIEKMFSPKKLGVKLSTVHRAKGLEAERVFILNASLMPGKWAKKDWEKVQEENLLYVALTRSKDFLGFIDMMVKR